MRLLSATLPHQSFASELAAWHDGSADQASQNRTDWIDADRDSRFQIWLAFLKLHYRQDRCPLNTPLTTANDNPSSRKPPTNILTYHQSLVSAPPACHQPVAPSNNFCIIPESHLLCRHPSDAYSRHSANEYSTSNHYYGCPFVTSISPGA